MLVARPPLQSLPMSTIQRETRRLSTRVQEKEDAPLPSSQAQHTNGNVKSVAASSYPAAAQNVKANARKRKMNYDEEDDGFTFKRVKKKEPEPKPAEGEKATTPAQGDASESQQAPTEQSDAPNNDDTAPKPRVRRKRMSFSTPKPKGNPPPRRSKRLSKDNDHADASPAKRPSREEVSSKHPERRVEPRPREAPNRAIRREPPKKQPEQRTLIADHSPRKRQKEQMEEDPNDRHSEGTQDGHQAETVPTLQENSSGTRIALPLADTPVIKRNKAMREGKSAKGERRSSLGNRGRRASSLIESGTSNALPHSEVDVADYYKHIESEGLPEPRRMRQLLTWCAERALDEKPIGTEFEHSSARQAARVIEEELLKELSSKSELSDWFAREDVPVPKQPLPERPNPKNVQNLEKLAGLEEQIKRHDNEDNQSFLQPPSLPTLHQGTTETEPWEIDRSLLSEAEAVALNSIAPATNPASADQISQRINEILESIGPTIDQFADGVHQLGQYQTAAENVAGRTLALCAEKLAEREKQGRKKALATAGQMPPDTPPKDIASVLRSLSRADR
ncbi:hypothetical protein A1O7_01223 [Cladophialophora yegresii CBS 114405]|uniref:Kinetochore protein Mis13/DSN1 n=1 Tax=Cladophialophora yegresii CBS 114405 TaxID=1182544 RepID=W9X331_9EURO|nr:uncharacterized protein A1O7_01223 [Cladophialophora yegresii CBS 114405]EXJ64884.1 hypothetical protein A1O7_01223 [Cladophialophora yegresii CBS 114405]